MVNTNITPTSKQLGGKGEDIAVQYLQKKGYKILDRNFKRKWGEIDIVAKPPFRISLKYLKKRAKIIFVEVKTIRKNKNAPFFPEDEVDKKKKYQLRKMAQIYLSAKNLPLTTPYQIDIIAVETDNFGKKTIRHFENAIEDRL